MVATVDTSRRLVRRGATRRSLALTVNEVLTSVAVVAVVILPWVLGGWSPSPREFVPSLLLALAVGFTSTATVIMSIFDLGSLPGAVDRTPESAAATPVGAGSPTRRPTR